jgi:tRNA pseudouridine38-40 synthase
MARIRLDVSYDGTGFSGWAVQPDRRTVAGVLGAELDRILGAGTATGLTVAGRTDAGVHATGQVCHVDLPDDAWSAVSATLIRRLAGLLPSDVRIRAAQQVDDTFDARFSALYRRYQYRVTDARYGAEPLRRFDTLAWPRPLDVDLLNAAAYGLVGRCLLPGNGSQPGRRDAVRRGRAPSTAVAGQPAHSHRPRR